MWRTIIPLILILVSVSLVQAALRVELDGSGDFVNIQDAVNAAVSGDTLLIGPGRWDETFTYTTPEGGWTDETIVATDGKDLVLIGAGVGETIIGPEVPPVFGLTGPNAIVLVTNHELELKDLTIDNMSIGIYSYGTSIFVSEVQIRGCRIGVLAFGSGGNFYRECEFLNCLDVGISASSDVSHMLIDHCMFHGTRDIHISARNVENSLISDCEFRDATVSIQFSGESCHGTIQRCVVNSGRGPHFGARAYSRMVMNDCTLIGGLRQIYATGFAEISGSGNQLLGTSYDGGGYSTIAAQRATIDLHDSHILKGDAQYSVQYYDFYQDDLLIVDLRNNYWGTADPDTLASWFWNEDDDPEMNVQTLVEPFSPVPIPAERKGMGDLKRMFR